MKHTFLEITPIKIKSRAERLKVVIQIIFQMNVYDSRDTIHSAEIS